MRIRQKIGDVLLQPSDLLLLDAGGFSHAEFVLGTFLASA